KPRSKVGLIWSPRSNIELYGDTTDVRTAKRMCVKIALAPDWSPTPPGVLTLNLSERYADSCHLRPPERWLILFSLGLNTRDLEQYDPPIRDEAWTTLPFPFLEMQGADVDLSTTDTSQTYKAFFCI